MLVLPGLGSLLVGRVVPGILQCLAALVGFAMTSAWLVAFAGRAIELRDIPTEFGELFVLALVGLGLFGLGWTWSLLTSLAALRAARSAVARP